MDRVSEEIASINEFGQGIVPPITKMMIRVSEAPLTFAEKLDFDDIDNLTQVHDMMVFKSNYYLSFLCCCLQEQIKSTKKKPQHGAFVEIRQGVQLSGTR